MCNLYSETKRCKINRGKVNQTILSVIVNLGGMCFGIAESWSSPSLPLLMSKDSPLSPITIEVASWIGSLLFLGCLLSTPIYGYFVDKFGRKRTCYVVGVSFLTGWLIIYLAKTSTVLIIGRLIIGLSSGGAVVVAPAYIGDIAQDDIRGALASLFEMFINVGILFVYTVGAYLSYEQLTIVCFSVPLIYIIGIFCMPESPVFLLSVDKPDEAMKAMKWLRTGDSVSVEEEMSSMKRLLHARRNSLTESRPTIKEILLSRATRRGLITAFLLVIVQQMSGVVAMLSYTAMIFEESGNSISPNISSIYVGVVQLLGSFASTAVIDRFGRRFLTVVSNSGLSLCLATLLTYFAVKSYGINVTSFEYVPVVSLCVYIFFYAFGMGPMPFVILSEMFSPKIQGLVSSIVLLFLWTLAFFVAKTFSIIGSVLGLYSTYCLYLLFSVFGIIYGSFFLIETKNKRLETILIELGQ